MSILVLTIMIIIMVQFKNQMIKRIDKSEECRLRHQAELLDYIHILEYKINKISKEDI